MTSEEQESLREYNEDLINRIEIACQTNETFDDAEFYTETTELLSEAGILDNISEEDENLYRNKRKGMRIDGWAWNKLERRLYGIIVKFSNDPDKVDNISRAQLETLGKNVSRVFEKMGDEKFLNDLNYDERSTFDEIRTYLDRCSKFGVVIITNHLTSSRVKKIDIEKIRGLDASIESWDLAKLRDLEYSSGESSPIIVDFKELFGKGIDALSANKRNSKNKSFLCVLPGEFLSKLFHEHGQRLLESNVRSFLEFRGKGNKGMRETLVSEPENFFSFNNGLTVTATSHETEKIGQKLTITKLENLQIVNGGQTTSVLYFAPQDKTGYISGEDGALFFRDIDLSNVFLQMKLTVLGDDEDDTEMTSKISRFANTQAAVSSADLVSNHPLHLNIERYSRETWMPAGDEGFSSKWFYERSRGQYTMLLRAESTSSAKNQFKAQYPPKQKFVKTDMAKYENTWRMKPYEVKQGAQKNLELLGKVMTKEFEEKPEDFGPSFFRKLISKAILFKTSDTAILKSEWYKKDKGYKAETVTYTLAFLRHLLKKQEKDLNLQRIYENQKLSETLLHQILKLAEHVRTNLMDDNFRDGTANISQFCKKQEAWFKVRDLPYQLIVEDADVQTTVQQADDAYEDDQLNVAGTHIELHNTVMGISANEWLALAQHFTDAGYSQGHEKVDIPMLCVAYVNGQRDMTERQLRLAVSIRSEATGFSFIRD